MERFKVTKNKYKFDRLIFISYLGLIIILILAVFIKNDFDFKRKFYIKCGDMTCRNPFYDNKKCVEDWCRELDLPKGEYGQPPDKFFMFVLNWWYIGFAFCFLINHLIYNREWDYEKVFGNLPEK